MSFFKHRAKALVKVGTVTEARKRIMHCTMLQVAGAIHIERRIMKHNDQTAHQPGRIHYGRHNVRHVEFTEPPPAGDRVTRPAGGGALDAPGRRGYLPKMSFTASLTFSPACLR